MRDRHSKWWVWLLCVAMLASAAFSQKVKVGYDKSVNFSQYKTYSWVEPGMPPVYPRLYVAVANSVDAQLSSKGLKSIDKDGDLILIPAGGVGFGSNVAAGTPIIGTFSGPPPAMDTTMWTGAEGPSTSGTMVSEGTIVLAFVDRSANKVVWTGSVSQKLDIEEKDKSLQLAAKAVVKLLKPFPPKSSSSK